MCQPLLLIKICNFIENIANAYIHKTNKTLHGFEKLDVPSYIIFGQGRLQGRLTFVRHESHFMATTSSFRKQPAVCISHVKHVRGRCQEVFKWPLYASSIYLLVVWWWWWVLFTSAQFEILYRLPVSWRFQSKVNWRSSHRERDLLTKKNVVAQENLGCGI